MFKRIKELENEVEKLKNELYENLDEQKIEKMSKKYKTDIDLVPCPFNYVLYLNNFKAATGEILNKHEYIQSYRFERDIKAFLYSKKEEK